tara:strand:+ start:1321 stop:1509 length:189 start_codon:yes stop_codon:yes gene_type:complete
MKPRARMLLVPPLAALSRKKLTIMPTDIFENHCQPKQGARRSRTWNTANFSEIESSVRLIQD